VDDAILDVPRESSPDDADAYLRTAMAWHFAPGTGSPFWLRGGRPGVRSADRGPTFDDLRLFRNLGDELQSTPVEQLVARGYGSPAPVPTIYESGGTTGAPKRTTKRPDWSSRSAFGRCRTSPREASSRAAWVKKLAAPTSTWTPSGRHADRGRRHHSLRSEDPVRGVWVIDPDTGEQGAYGERLSALEPLPNLDERATLPTTSTGAA
jgi:hypothetical protein